MSLYWEDSARRLYNGDCRDMSALEDDSVQCVVTSPPYWGLRKYAGVPDLVWGGDPDCDHQWGSDILGDTRADAFKDWGNEGSGRDAPHVAVSQGAFCQCGAWRGSYGLEPTPEMYVDHTIEVLREVRRVLRDDGVVFWNIADRRPHDTKWGGSTGGKHVAALHGKTGIGRAKTVSGIKPKDMALIPFRVALAAQADGWYVRSDIIWAKSNPMPESVRDRPTSSHEYIFMLTKSARYYWDAEAVRERSVEPERVREDNIGGASWEERQQHSEGGVFTGSGGRNVRSVWSFPSQPYPDAHFATFPEALPERCIKAATPELGCCEKCGAPWERVIERTGHVNKREPAHAPNSEPTKTDSTGWAPLTRTNGAWRPTCQCNAGKVPSTVLDPFAGSGTTLKVAAVLGRHADGYELSPEYCELAVKRNRQGVML